MPALAQSHATLSQSPIKLDTLIGLRWVAIAGQTAAILVVGVMLFLRLRGAGQVQAGEYLSLTPAKSVK